MVRKFLVAAGVATILGGVGASAALADPVYTLQNCFSAGGGNGCAQEGAFLSAGVASAVPSPDGKFVYALARNGPMVLYSRDPHLGGLTKVQTLSPLTDAANPTDMVISPDGETAYIAGSNGFLAVYGRDPGTGALAFGACYGPSGGCGGISGLQSASSLNIALPPDGKNLYVGTFNSGTQDTIEVFSRNTTSGVIAPIQCVSANTRVGCTTIKLKGGERQMAVTPNNKFIYTTAGDGTTNAIVVLPRDADGMIDTANVDCYGTSGGGCHSTNANVVTPDAVLIPPDPTQKELYVAGADGLDVYSYDDTSGALIHIQCLNGDGSNGCLQVLGFGADAQPPGHMALSPDGTDLAVPDAQGVVFLKRDPTTGLLSQLGGGAGCLTANGATDGCRTFGEFGGPQNPDLTGSVNAAPDASQFYVAFSHLNVIAGVRSDNPPACAGANLSTAFQTAVGVPVNCADPDGEPVDVQLLGAPAHGVVSALSTGGSVYNPFAGFSGADTFSFQAVSHTLTSAPATDTISIGAAPPPPPAPPKRITSAISTEWLAGSTTHVSRLTVKNVPKAGTVKITCKGKKHAKHKGGCTFSSKRFKESKGKSALALAKYFKKAKLQPGTTLTIAITASGDIGKEVVFTIRKHKLPSSKTLCFPVGKSKAQKKC